MPSLNMPQLKPKYEVFATVAIITIVSAGVVLGLHATQPKPRAPEVPAALSRSCPALLRDYQNLSRDLAACRRGWSADSSALRECRAITGE